MEWTNAEISLKIAEFLEPRGTLTALTAADFDRGVIDEKVISPLGCWYFIRDEAPVWHPRDFVDNPAMTVKLIIRMIDDEDYHNMCEGVRLTDAALDDGTSASFTRAVAEAFINTYGL